ncbi:MAG: hypothetical protein EP305_09700 [Bacteroidetes bacterium]|jgi:hypothetical protein|nr:MAG: hypothetical protein EP305_09700 [Bacteroidota bacterium]
MRKFSIHKENKELEPSEEQIRRHKDFSRLHHDYERLTKRGKKPIYQDPKLYMLLVLIGIILLIIFLED